MVLYGDRYVEIWSLPQWNFYKMPTAIITANTTEGLFIAADGRVRKEEHGVSTVLSDKQQKIFEITDSRTHFAFAVTGTAAFTADGEKEIIFDFNTAVPTAADELRGTVCADVTNYCERLARTVNRMLRDSVEMARQKGKTVTCPSNPDPSNLGHKMIAMLFLCGHYSHRSYHVLYKFFHRNGVIAAPLVDHICPVGKHYISGSGIVANLLYRSSDDRFSTFRHSLESSENLSFGEWAAIAKDYVGACDSPAGLEVDSEICSGIGGHVHAATITATEGFKWLPGFEPI